MKSLFQNHFAFVSDMLRRDKFTSRMYKEEFILKIQWPVL
jgi:hypothetical protein